MTSSLFEQISMSLPWILLIWTWIALMWGTSVGAAYRYIINRATSDRGRCRTCDMYISRFVWITNSILLASLLLQQYLPEFANDAFNAVLVIDIFYSAFLCVASNSVFKWWKFKFKKSSQQVTNLQQIHHAAP